MVAITCRSTTGQCLRLLSDCMEIRVLPARPIRKVKRVSARRSLLKRWHRKRCGDQDLSLPPICGLGVTETYLASNQRSRGQHSEPAPLRTLSVSANILVLQTGEAGSAPAGSTNTGDSKAVIGVLSAEMRVQIHSSPTNTQGMLDGNEQPDCESGRNGSNP